MPAVTVVVSTLSAVLSSVRPVTLSCVCVRVVCLLHGAVQRIQHSVKVHSKNLEIKENFYSKY